MTTTHLTKETDTTLMHLIPRILHTELIKYMGPITCNTFLTVYPYILSHDTDAKTILKQIVKQSTKLRILWSPIIYNILSNQFPTTLLFHIYSALIHFNPKFTHMSNTRHLNLITLNNTIIHQKTIPSHYRQYFNYNNSNASSSTFSEQIPIHNTINIFQSNMNSWFHYRKWKDAITPSMFIAGGCIAQAMFSNSPINGIQDIDIFLLEPCTSTKNSYYDKTIKQFVQFLQSQSKDVIYINKYTPSAWYNQHLITTIYVNFSTHTTHTNDHMTQLRIQYIIDNYEHFWTKFQFIGQPITSKKWQILSRFDLNCCQIGFDGHNVLATHACINAFATKSLLSYQCNNIGIPWWKRADKYTSRFNLTCLTPKEFDPSTTISDGFYMQEYAEKYIQYKESITKALRNTIHFKLLFATNNNEIVNVPDHNYDHFNILESINLTDYI